MPPTLAQDACDAVNLLVQAGELPADIHYAIIDDSNREACVYKCGPFLAGFPKDFSKGKVHVALWRQVAGQPFLGIHFADPRDLITAAVRHYLGRGAWS